MNNEIYKNGKEILKMCAQSLNYLGKHDKPLRRQTLNDTADDIIKQFNFHAMKGTISEKQAAIYADWIIAYCIKLHTTYTTK